MEAVKAFNNELSSLYDCKPPISKAKMSGITKGAIRAIKFYKHVVQSVEKFIQKCRPEYKVPGLYVIDSIVRQSRHQFGVEKDVFGPRFARNVNATFYHLYKCHPDEKSRIIRVLNLWQKNNVFTPEVIQPLFDLADPNHPLHKEIQSQLDSSKAKALKPAAITVRGDLYDGAGEDNEPRQPPPPPEPTVDQNVIQQLQQLQQLLVKHQEQQNNNQTEPEPPERPDRDGGRHGRDAMSHHQSQRSDPFHVKFNKKLLDFDYGDDDEEDQRDGHRNYHHGYRQPPLPPPQPPPQQPPADQGNTLDTALTTLLSNPELMKQLQSMTTPSQPPQMSPVKKVATPEDRSRRLQQEEEQFNREIQHSYNDIPDGYSERDRERERCQNPPPPPPPNMGGPPPPNAAPFSFPPPHHMDLSRPPPGFGPPSRFGAMGSLNVPPPSGDGAPMAMPPSGPPQSDRHPPEDDRRDRDRHQEEEIDLSRDDDRVRDHRRSRSRSDSRGRSSRKRRRSGSRSRDRDRDRRRHRSRSRSGSRSRRSRRRSRSRDRDRERDHKKDRMRREEDERDREREKERQKKGLPPFRKEYLTVCSTTLWVGHLSSRVQEEELSEVFGEYGGINSIDLIPPRGCAFIVMNRRQDACKVLSKLKNYKIQGKAILIAWAPGKGMKESPFKDCWEADLGASYIPWSKVSPDQDVLALEEGGMIDEETCPPWIHKPGPPPPVNMNIVPPQEAANLGGIPPPFTALQEAPPGGLEAAQVATSEGPPRLPAPTLLPPFLMHNLPPGNIPGAGLLLGLQQQLGAPIHAPPPQLVMPHGLLQHPPLPGMPPAFQPQPAPGPDISEIPMETDDDSRGKEDSNSKSFGDMDIQEVTPDRYSRDEDKDKERSRKSRWEREDRDRRDRDRDDKRRDVSREHDRDRDKGRGDRREDRKRGSHRWDSDASDKDTSFINPDNPLAVIDQPPPTHRPPPNVSQPPPPPEGSGLRIWDNDGGDMSEPPGGFRNAPPPPFGFPPRGGDMFNRFQRGGMRGRGMERGRFPPPFRGRGGFGPPLMGGPPEGFNPVAFGNDGPPPMEQDGFDGGWGRGGPRGHPGQGMNPWGPDRGGMRDGRMGRGGGGFNEMSPWEQPPMNMDDNEPEAEHPWKAMMSQMESFGQQQMGSPAKGNDRSRSRDRDSRGGDKDRDRDSRGGDKDRDRDSRGGDKDRDRDSRGGDKDRDSQAGDRDGFRGRKQEEERNSEREWGRGRGDRDRDRGRDFDRDRNQSWERESAPVNPWAEIIQQMQQGGGAIDVSQPKKKKDTEEKDKRKEKEKKPVERERNQRERDRDQKKEGKRERDQNQEKEGEKKEEKEKPEKQPDQSGENKWEDREEVNRREKKEPGEEEGYQAPVNPWAEIIQQMQQETEPKTDAKMEEVIVEKPPPIKTKAARKMHELPLSVPGEEPPQLQDSPTPPSSVSAERVTPPPSPPGEMVTSSEVDAPPQEEPPQEMHTEVPSPPPTQPQIEAMPTLEESVSEEAVMPPGEPAEAVTCFSPQDMDIEASSVVPVEEPAAAAPEVETASETPQPLEDAAVDLPVADLASTVEQAGSTDVAETVGSSADDTVPPGQDDLSLKQCEKNDEPLNDLDSAPQERLNSTQEITKDASLSEETLQE